MLELYLGNRFVWIHSSFFFGWSLATLISDFICKKAESILKAGRGERDHGQLLLNLFKDYKVSITSVPPSQSLLRIRTCSSLLKALR